MANSGKIIKFACLAIAKLAKSTILLRLPSMSPTVGLIWPRAIFIYPLSPVIMPELWQDYFLKMADLHLRAGGYKMLVGIY